MRRCLGVDLAWGAVNETGVVALGAGGRVLAAGWTVGVDATAAARPASRTLSETYPYTTLVGAAELGYDGERARYKRPPRGCPA